MNRPLVSVGIPTFSRPEELRKALECICRQEYSQLEIIVGDNASPGPATEELVRSFMARDKRVCYYKHAQNMGAAFNFKYVLKKATGDYFMWVADDDIYLEHFVRDIMMEFANPQEPSVVAINMEAQYFDGLVLFPFFPEGRAFYSPTKLDVTSRLAHLIRYNYGNLIYSIYNMKMLRSINAILVDNEIPFLLQVAEKGQFLVLPKVGFHKKTVAQTYRQAKWEKQGGALPDSSFTLGYYRSLRSNLSYHRTALTFITRSISELTISNAEKERLSKVAKRSIQKHFRTFVFRWKRRSLG